MKKLVEKLGLETLIGGIFGLITLIAIVVEVAMAGFSADAVVGGIKDFFGTLITVVMLAVAINALRPKAKKDGNFDSTFQEEMDILAAKYEPIFRDKGEDNSKSWGGYYRYDIASKPDGIATNDPGTLYKFFYIKSGADCVEFSISTTVFSERKGEVATQIASKIEKQFSSFVSDIVIKEPGFVLNLRHPLEGTDDAKTMAQIVDRIIMLYMAEYKK